MRKEERKEGRGKTDHMGREPRRIKSVLLAFSTKRKNFFFKIRVKSLGRGGK